MEPTSKVSRGPPKPACEIKGEPYYNIPAAAWIIKVVSKSTVRRWAVKGWTSFGFPLDVVRRKGHLLIPELSVGVVEEFLKKHPLPQPGATSDVRKEFRRAVRHAMFDLMTPRSAYSRARSPRLQPPVPR